MCMNTFERYTMRRTSILFSAVLCISMLTACGQTTKIELPDPQQITKVEITSDGTDSNEYTGAQFQKALTELKTAVSTHRQSVNDIPDIVDAIKIDMFFENGSSRCYVYQDGGKHYVEQPYEGVFQIGKSAYQSVLDLTDNS